VHDSGAHSQRDEWRERVESIGPALRAQTAVNEGLRRLSPETEAALRSIDVFGLCSPSELGGANAEPLAQTHAIAALTAHDSSAGWCSLIGAHESSWLATRLPEEAANRVFAHSRERWPVAAGSIAPEGEAVEVNDGWQVNGRWGWASGIHHSDYVLAQCRIADREAERGKPPPLATVVAPTPQVEIEDTWHTLGMRGTGSTHYRFDDLFIPAEMTLVGFERPPLRGDGWLARPTVTFLTAAGYGFPLGVARRALAEITEMASTRIRTGQRDAIALQRHVQLDIGECAALLDVMEGFAEHQFPALLAAPVESLDEIVRLASRARAALRWADQSAERIVRVAHEHAGGAAVYDDNPLPRLLRDIQTVSQHVIQIDSAYIRYGQHQLGLEVRPGL